MIDLKDIKELVGTEYLYSIASLDAVEPNSCVANMIVNLNAEVVNNTIVSLNNEAVNNTVTTL